jgi:hypothetical protein
LNPFHFNSVPDVHHLALCRQAGIPPVGDLNGLHWNRQFHTELLLVLLTQLQQLLLEEGQEGHHLLMVKVNTDEHVVDEQHQQLTGADTVNV